MKYKYDLHLHSLHSDGDYSLPEIFKMAKKNGLKAIVITDHNLLINPSFNKKLAKKYNIKTLEGLEISTKYKGVEIHILGYSQRFNYKTLNAGLKKTQQGYDKRVKKIIENLKKLGITINFSKLKKQKQGPCLFKYDLVKELKKKTGLPIQELLKWVDRGGIVYVPYGKWAMKPWQAVKLIHRANGLAVLAHPGNYIKKFSLKRKEGEKINLFLIKRLIKNGLDGLEVNSSYHNLKQKKFFKKIAIKNNLVITGGSDWHGKIHHPQIKMGDGGLSKKEFELFLEKIKERSQI